MPKYQVTVSPENVFYYEIEADNEDIAVEKAKEYAMQENQYDLLKYAMYEIEQI